MGEPRARRDELLLDLGALVFELHRQGRRAPDLLTAKAAELDALDDAEPEDGETACSRCGAAAHAEQLVCLECGGRIALDGNPLEKAAWAAAEQAEADREPPAQRPAPSSPPSESPGATNGEPPSQEAPAHAVADGYSPPPSAPPARQPWWPQVLGGISFAIGVGALTLLILLALGGSGSEAPRPEARLGAAPASSLPRASDTPARPARRKRPAVPGWSHGSGYTVVLLTTGDLGSARQAAERLRGQGVRAGVLRNGGFWLVFSGRYKDRALAYGAARRLRERLGAAYVQFIER